MCSQYWVAYLATIGDWLGQGYHELQVLSARKLSALFSHRNGGQSSLHFSCHSMHYSKALHQFHSTDRCTIKKHDISSIPWIYAQCKSMTFSSIPWIAALWKSMTSVPFHGYMHYAEAWDQFHSMDLCTMQKYDMDLCTVQKALHQFHPRDLCTLQKHDISSIPWIGALWKSMTLVPFHGYNALCKNMTSVPFHGSTHYAKAWQGCMHCAKSMTPVPFQGSIHFAKAWHQFHSMDRRTMKKHDTSSNPWIYALCKSMTSVPFHGSMHYAKALYQFPWTQDLVPIEVACSNTTLA